MRQVLLCQKCQSGNNVDLGSPVNIIEDTVSCFCGEPLPLPAVTAMDYKWQPSRIVGQFTLDSLTGQFRRSVEIFPVADVEDMMLEGVVMKVYGDTEDGVRSLAEHICNWHNAAWQAETATMQATVAAVLESDEDRGNATG